MCNAQWQWIRPRMTYVTEKKTYCQPNVTVGRAISAGAEQLKGMLPPTELSNYSASCERPPAREMQRP